MKLIPREEMPEYLKAKYGISRTLRQLDYWRTTGRGPAYHHLEGRYFYSAKDVAEWISASRVDPSQNDPITQEDIDRDRGKAAGGC